MSHYTTLSVPKNATQEEIKKSYRKLAALHHPDRPGGDTKKFQEIQSAYAVLSDTAKKEEYDQESVFGGRQGHHRAWSNTSGMDDNNDIMRHFQEHFGARFGDSGGSNPFNTRSRQEPTNRDIRFAVNMNLVDTLIDHVKTVEVNSPGRPSRTIELKIPAGVHSGMSIKYPGMGDQSIKDKPAGSAIATFTVIYPPEFTQNGIDLITNLEVNSFEAMLGCTKNVNGIDGKTYELTIPSGVQPGTKLGIKGAGMLQLYQIERGRLIVMVHVSTPTNLSAAQKDVIRSVAST